MRDQYIIRYKTGLKGIVVSWVMVAVFAILMLLLFAIGFDSPAFFCGLALLFMIFVAFYFLRSYREIQLYADKMEVVSLFDGTITVIQFRDIKHIGFLHGHSNSSYNRRFGGSSAGTDIAELIILLYSGGREQFLDEDYDSLNEVCAFISERIGRTEQVF